VVDLMAVEVGLSTRPATGVAVLLDVLEDAREGERIVLG